MSPENRSNKACPFCAIVHDGAPAIVVREWDDALCIVPLAPVTPGHLLVLPKAHVETFFSAPDVSALTMRRAAELVHGVERHHDRNDYNIITSAGEAATQTEKHLHVHVVPRQRGDGLALPWSPSAAEASLADDLLAVRTENACINEKWTESRARVAAVERERDGWKACALEDEQLIQMRERDVSAARVERDAAVAENARLLARIAAVEAQNEKLRRSTDAWWEEYDEALSAMRSIRDTMQREHDLGRVALGGYLILLDRALAASPTPTGPEPATAECEYYGHFTVAGQRYHHNIAYDGARIEKCGPATPEPTEETP